MWYYSGSDGTDITTQVTGAGWTTPSLRPGEYRELELDVIPPEGAAVDAEQTVLVTATCAADALRSDTVKAAAVYRVVRGVDGLVRNASGLLGDGVINIDATGQTASSESWSCRPLPLRRAMP